jgi:Fur family ferric uptake transcriptional regulator
VEDIMPAKTTAGPEPPLASAEARLRAHLRTRGLKYTRERRAILRAVMENEEHFEAEELLLNMRQRGVRVAKATIYRTLPLLVEAGIVREVIYGEKHAHYEHTFGHTPHDHMVCQRCGCIIEFDSEEVRDLMVCISRREGFEPVSHRFQIAGLCRRCGGQPSRPQRSASTGPRRSRRPARRS